MATNLRMTKNSATRGLISLPFDRLRVRDCGTHSHPLILRHTLPPHPELVEGFELRGQFLTLSRLTVFASQHPIGLRIHLLCKFALVEGLEPDISQPFDKLRVRAFVFFSKRRQRQVSRKNPSTPRRLRGSSKSLGYPRSK